MFRPIDDIVEQVPVPAATLLALRQWAEQLLYRSFGVHLTLLVFGTRDQSAQSCPVPLYELVQGSAWADVIAELERAAGLYRRGDYAGSAQAMHACLARVGGEAVSPDALASDDGRLLTDELLVSVRQRLRICYLLAGDIAQLCAPHVYLGDQLDYAATLDFYQRHYIALRKGWYAQTCQEFTDACCEKYRRLHGIEAAESSGRPSAKDHCLASAQPFCDASPISFLGSRWLALHCPGSDRQTAIMLALLRALRIGTVVSLQEMSERSATHSFWPTSVDQPCRLATADGDALEIWLRRQLDVAPPPAFGDRVLEYVTIRQLEIVRPGEPSQWLCQFHLRLWEDYGLPHPLLLFWFMDLIRQFKFRPSCPRTWKDAPTAIHCHSGVGRTGLFIMLFAVWQYNLALRTQPDSPSTDPPSSSPRSSTPLSSPRSSTPPSSPRSPRKLSPRKLSPPPSPRSSSSPPSSPRSSSATSPPSPRSLLTPRSSTGARSASSSQADNSSTPSQLRSPSAVRFHVESHIPELLIRYRLQREGVQGAEQLSFLSVMAELISSHPHSHSVAALAGPLCQLGRELEQRFEGVPVLDSCNRYAAYLDASGVRPPPEFKSKADFEQHLLQLSLKVSAYVFGIAEPDAADLPLRRLVEHWCSKLCKLGRAVSRFFYDVIDRQIVFSLLDHLAVAPARLASDEDAQLSVGGVHYGEEHETHVRLGPDVFYIGASAADAPPQPATIDLSGCRIRPSLLQRVLTLASSEEADQLLGEIVASPSASSSGE